MTHRLRKPEVLAPAGSPAALRAALWHGADSVYFGLSEGFNARARAVNFAVADLPAVTAQIHRAGARAYVALNTLVFEPELPAVERLLRAIVASGVDALIVQDPAVCLLARAVCPDLELHASTQMTIAEPAAVPFAKSLGVSRVVVPRELSVAEIRAFAAATDVELEVFVHGALCVSWSGQCLTSEAWGGRSANRGQCAQSCRMPYELVVDGELRPLGPVSYLLSPKDLAGASAVAELCAIGVHGLKIEGRQKSPTYVATATGGYRRWVDAIAAGVDRRAAERQLARDLLDMALAYSRGFSTGFLGGSDHQTLVEGRFPKHRGVLAGTVVLVSGNRVLVRAAGPEVAWTGGLGMASRPPGPAGAPAAPLPDTAPAPLELRPGLGIVFDQGQPERPDEPGGPLFAVERSGDDLWLVFGRPGPDLARVRPGDRVYVTSDPGAAVRAARTSRDDAPEPEGRNLVDLAVAGRAGEPLEVTAVCRHCSATARSAARLQPARGAGLDPALLAGKLAAFGGTPFRLGALDTRRLAPDLFLPAGELKQLRRELVAALLPQLERGPARHVEPAPALPRVRSASPACAADAAAIPALVPLLRTDAQLDAALAAGCREVELDWMEFVGLGKACARARAGGAAVTVATTRVGKPGEQALVDRVLALEPDGILVRHFGALMRCTAARAAGARARLHGDFALNATNSLTVRHLLGLGLDTVTAAFDLDETQLFAMLAQVPPSRVAIVAHHRIPTFHTEHCVYSHLLSNGRDHRSCGRPCERHQVALRDHLGREHPIIVDVGCRNTVFHHAPQQSAHWTGRLLALGMRRFRVEFVREGAAEVTRVLAAWGDLLAGRIDAEEVARRTGASGQIGVAAGGMQLLVE